MFSYIKNRHISKKALLVIFLLVLVSFLAYDQVYAADSVTGALADGALTFIGLPVLTTIQNYLFQTLAWLVSGLLLLSGFILDFVLIQTIVNFADFTGSTSIVGVGWGIFRDLANLVFIFLILWIAISTILKLHQGSAMGSVLRIAVAALLINFSLFITKAVIDVSNILALHFYDLVTNHGDGSFSGAFMQGLYLQTLFNTGSGGALSDVLMNAKSTLIYAFGSIAMLIAAWCFLAAAVMFVVRALYLIVLMIFSPFAFIAWVIPGMAGKTHEWWDKLLKQSFFAPIFMVIIYIVGRTIQTSGTGAFGIAQGSSGFDRIANVLADNKADGLAQAAVAGNDPSFVGIAVNFILLIGMLIASLMVSNKLGAVGATTMINWGNAIRGAGQGWIMGNTVGRGARWANERLGQTWIGNTAVGKTLRDWTVVPLKDAKWGSKMSGEERYKESEELRSTRREIAEIQGAPFSKSEHNVVAILEKIKSIKTKGKNEIAELAADLEKATASGDEVAIKKAEEAKKEAEKIYFNEVDSASNDLQRVLAKLTPHAIAELTPENLFYDSEFIENLTDSQLKAILESERLSEDKRDRVRLADNKEYIEAIDVIEKKKMPEYDKKHREYLEKSQLSDMALETVLEAKDIDQVLSENGFNAQSTGKELAQYVRTKEELEKTVTKLTAEIPPDSDLFSSYQKAQNNKERKKARKTLEIASKEILGIKEPDKPLGLSVVDPRLRNRIRASSNWRLEQFYKANPDEVLKKPFMMTARSGFTTYMRENPNTPMGDRDKVREQKFGDMIDAKSLVNGLGELKPTFETFNTMVGKMVELGARGIDDLKRLTRDQYEGMFNTEKEWESLRNNRLTPEIKKIAMGGKMHKYVESFTPEQKAMAKWGDKKMAEAIGGKSKGEYRIMRGWMWRNPAFAKYIDRGIAGDFTDKDTEDIKEVMDMILHDFRRVLATKDLNNISRPNLDLLSWIVNDRTGRLFVKRNNIASELKPVFDKMTEILDKQNNLNEETLATIQNEIDRDTTNWNES